MSGVLDVAAWVKPNHFHHAVRPTLAGDTWSFPCSWAAAHVSVPCAPGRSRLAIRARWTCPLPCYSHFSHVGSLCEAAGVFCTCLNVEGNTAVPQFDLELLTHQKVKVKTGIGGIPALLAMASVPDHLIQSGEDAQVLFSEGNFHWDLVGETVATEPCSFQAQVLAIP